MTLSLKNICKSFGSKQVLKDVDFTVSAGESLGYLGRNGAGKTTTIRIITDIFRPDSGQVLLDGKPIDRNKVSVGYLPEERGLYPKTKVGEQMIYIGELKGMTQADAKKRAMQLLEEVEGAEYWSKKLDTLSKGNQQKIQLAIAVLNDPDIVILDEPFSGLDPVNATILKRLILKQVSLGKIVLFSSHQMSYVEEFCEDIVILNQGQIVVGGKIRDIKRTYPRNRLAVSPEGDIETFLASLTNMELWHKITSNAALKGEELEITLKDPENKKDLIQMLTALPMGVDKIHVIEPTLEEIFVEKAGDQV
ncbi:MAG: ATP-binding cassette domain-containing protein [Defluviitaleaceae bacterium]|nr:ATP-binding cassette domain-containing protein [Defluviitaleaceae bacterium]